MESLLIVVHGAVSWVLMSAGATKAWHPEIASDLRAFGILPVGKGFLRALGVVEVGFGAGMNLGGSLGWVVLALVAGLFLLMTTQVGIWVLSGKRGDCGCGIALPMRDLSAAHALVDGLLFLATVALTYHRLRGDYLWAGASLPIGPRIALLLAPCAAYAIWVASRQLRLVRAAIVEIDRRYL